MDVVKYVTGSFCLIFLLLLLYLLFRIWLEGRRERISPRVIPGEALPDELRENALRPLKVLNTYYQKRDPEQADTCIDEVMLPEEILILGTNPGEIFHGREYAKGLLRGDWKYWGKLALDVNTTSLCRTAGTLYFATRGLIRLDRIRFRFPGRISSAKAAGSRTAGIGSTGKRAESRKSALISRIRSSRSARLTEAGRM